jgi:predicted phage terminase large subunit-like protein
MAEIEKEKESYKNIGKLDTWLRERQCVAVSDESRVFHKDDFRYFNRNVLMKTQDNLSFYMTIDPATSKNAEADYSVCLVMAVDENNNWFVVDMQYGNWSSPELIDNIFNLVVQWKLNAIGIEKGILKLAIEPFILKEMTRRNIFFDITPLYHAGTAKVDRIKMIAPRFKAHSVWFAQDMPWLTELESELLAMTRDGSKGLRDDACDALAYMEKIATAPFRRGRGTENLQRQAVMN